MDDRCICMNYMSSKKERKEREERLRLEAEVALITQIFGNLGHPLRGHPEPFGRSTALGRASRQCMRCCPSASALSFSLLVMTITWPPVHGG